MTLIERAIRSYINWRYKRASARNYKIILRQNPTLRHIDEAQRDAVRQHRPSRHFDDARKAAVTAMLKQGRG